jgi:hypothetical protein
MEKFRANLKSDSMITEECVIKAVPKHKVTLGVGIGIFSDFHQREQATWGLLPPPFHAKL